MKIERRGKYAGVKLHLDREECEKIIGFNPMNCGRVLNEIIGKIREAIKEDPTILEDRSEEEIQATLMKEYTESEKKLKHIKEGLDWKKVKVTVEK